MARITVEDCVLKIPNRFDLVVMAAQRARQIAAGAALTVERDRDKNPVVALREIADETIDLIQLKESAIKGFQKISESDEPEEELLELLAEEQIRGQTFDSTSLLMADDEENLDLDEDEDDDTDDEGDIDLAEEEIA